MGRCVPLRVLMGRKNLKLATEIRGAHCTVREAARYARCHRKTIRRWIVEGRLEAKRPVNGGSSRLRIVTESLRDLLGETGQ